MFSLLNFCHVLGKSCDLFKIFLKSLLRIILFIFLIATCISLSLHCLYSYFSFRLSYLLMYWVGQKVRLGFSVSCLANPIPMTHSLKTEDEMLTEDPMEATQGLP